MGSDPDAPQRSQDAADALTDLCRLFWTQGGMPGTAGGMSVREGSIVYMSPSGVQKERMQAEDLLQWNLEQQQWLYKPSHLKPSASTPLFLRLHEARNAGSVIHTHSQTAVLASILAGEHSTEFRISHVENIKAIPRVVQPGNLAYNDTLVIPIIDNQASEEELEPDLIRALHDYPGTSAVLVRRHGLYVWGSTVWKAKIVYEALDHLLELAMKMHQLGMSREPLANKHP